METIGKIKQMITDGVLTQEDAEKYFPELKENLGEKVKRILHSISSKIGSHLRDIFTEEEFQCFDAWSNAWLEKQGQTFTKKDVDDAYLEGMCVAKHELEKQCEQKPTKWSEEDKTMLCYMEGHLEYLKNDKGYSSSEDQIMLKRQLDWLKSLKDRCTWKPSDEQMEALRYVTNFDYGGHKATLVSLYEQLKKLKE